MSRSDEPSMGPESVEHGPGGMGGFREKIVPLVVAATFFMQLLDTSILNTSLPKMAESFGVKPLDMSVGVTVYMLVFAALLPLSGWLSERFGARRVFLCAVVVFTASSLACGMADRLWTFTLARAIQGFAASMMTPVGRAIVLKTTPKSGYLQAIATIVWPSLAAPLLGPLVGGFVTTWASWRWNFYMNIPIGIASLVLIRRFVPRFEPDAGRRFDVTGFVLSSTALAGLLHGIEALARGEIGDWFPWASVLWGAAGGALAIRHLRRAAHPLLDLAPMDILTFRITSLTAGLWLRVAISTTPFLLPLMFQVGLGLNAFQAGAFLSVYFAGNLAMKSVTTATLKRYGFRPVVVANGLAVGASLLAMVLVGPGLGVVATGIVLFAAGLVRSMQFTCFSSLAFADVPKASSASASTFASMANQSAMALGVALAAGLLNLSREVSDRAGLALADFRWAFAGVGVVALMAAWRLRVLPADAGAEITGRGSDPRNRAPSTGSAPEGTASRTTV